MKCQTNLLKIVAALAAPSRFASGLNCRQQESHQDADDGDDDQQFNQRECSATPFHHKTPFGNPAGRVMQTNVSSAKLKPLLPATMLRWPRAPCQYLDGRARLLTATYIRSDF